MSGFEIKGQPLTLAKIAQASDLRPARTAFVVDGDNLIEGPPLIKTRCETRIARTEQISIRGGRILTVLLLSEEGVIVSRFGDLGIEPGPHWRKLHFEFYKEGVWQIATVLQEPYLSQLVEVPGEPAQVLLYKSNGQHIPVPGLLHRTDSFWLTDSWTLSEDFAIDYVVLADQSGRLIAKIDEPIITTNCKKIRLSFSCDSLGKWTIRGV